MTHSKLGELREAATGCTGCDLYKTGTQVVFGEGPRDAGAVFVGEQPGRSWAESRRTASGRSRPSSTI